MGSECRAGPETWMSSHAFCTYVRLFRDRCTSSRAEAAMSLWDGALMSDNSFLSRI